MRQMTHGINVWPNVVREGDDSVFYNSLTNMTALKAQLVRGMEVVLDLMLNSGMTKCPDRQAVFFNCQFFKTGKCIDRMVEKIGTTFPTYKIANKCRSLASEKVNRTVDSSLLCSYQNRIPESDKYGGSAGIVFNLFPNDKRSFYFTIIGASDGLMEWENMSLFLGCLHYLEFIEFCDQQIQNILNTADFIVAGQPEFLPDGMTIKEYVEALFLKIDEDFLLTD